MVISIFLLCSIIDPACCMAMVLIFLNMCLMVDFGILSFVSRSSIEGVCVVPLTPAVMTMSGSTLQPRFMMLFIRGLYFWILFSIVSYGNLSLQYVNSMNCIVRLSDGFDGGLLLYGWPFIHRISGLHLALHWHRCCPHELVTSHEGIVFSWGFYIYWLLPNINKT